MDNRPLGIFDTGLGGLSCLSGLLEQLPQENYVYFGDTARAPYGDYPDDAIRAYTFEIADFLCAQNVKALVIACNTISTLCVEPLRERFPGLPVIGIITPAVEHLASGAYNNRRVGLIATAATVRSEAHKKGLMEKGFAGLFDAQAAPLLAPLVEQGVLDGPRTDEALHSSIDPLVERSNIDALVLGCTHYPFFVPRIRALYPNLEIVNPSRIIVDEVERTLNELDLRAGQATPGERTFYASALTDAFAAWSRRVMEEAGENPANAQFIEHPLA